MAENELSQLPSAAGFTPAGVRHVGSGWGPDATRRTERMDQELHLPFDKLLPPEPLPPPPAPPTEAELRDQLAQAIEAKRGRETELSRAEAAHQRAEEHLSRCQARMASYASIGADIVEATILALRCDAGRFDPTMSEEHEIALNDRVKAEAELLAAEAAVLQFLRERADASQAMGDATRAAETLATRVLGHHADALAREHDDCIAQAKLRRSALFAFERLTTATRVSISMAVRNVLGVSQDDFAKLHDASAWRAAHAALLADAQAEVGIALEVPARTAEAA
jgi:hypothetical protein